MPEKKKYIRTHSGDIWELSSDGFYRKPGVINHVSYDDKFIVESSDDLYKLIRPEDLVLFQAASGRIITEDDLVEHEGDKSYISSLLKLKAVYTTYSGEKYILQAEKINGLWIIH